MATRNSADPRCSSPQRTIAFVAENPTPTPTARHRSLRPSELADDRPGSLGLRARQTCQNASQLRVLPPPGAWTVTSSDATARHPGLGAVRTFSTTSRAARFARRRAATPRARTTSRPANRSRAAHRPNPSGLPVHAKSQLVRRRRLVADERGSDHDLPCSAPVLAPRSTWPPRPAAPPGQHSICPPASAFQSYVEPIFRVGDVG
jgi:hypothetical protein